MSSEDLITKMNKEAEYNVLNADFYGNDNKYFGEYENVRIPTEKKDAIKDIFRKVAVAC